MGDVPERSQCEMKRGIRSGSNLGCFKRDARAQKEPKLQQGCYRDLNIDKDWRSGRNSVSVSKMRTSGTARGDAAEDAIYQQTKSEISLYS